MCNKPKGCCFNQVQATSRSDFSLGEISRNSSLAVMTHTFSQFIGGKLAGIRFHQFLTSNQAASYADTAHTFGFKRYESAPEVGIIGTALVDSPALNAYLHLAEMWRRPEVSFKQSVELLTTMIAYLQVISGLSVQVMAVNGRTFHAGNWRLLTGGAGIHKDLITEDCQLLSTLQVEFQGSFILHIETPGNGGETSIWNRSGSQSDKLDPLYIKSGWKYSEVVVEGAEKVVVPAVTGDLVLLPTHLYHAVAPSSESNRERISFSSFILKLKDDNTLYLYS